MNLPDPRLLLERLRGLTRHLDAPGPPEPPLLDYIDPTTGKTIPGLVSGLRRMRDVAKEFLVDRWLPETDPWCALIDANVALADEAAAVAAGLPSPDPEASAAARITCERVYTDSKGRLAFRDAAPASEPSRTLAPSTNGHATTPTR